MTHITVTKFSDDLTRKIGDPTQYIQSHYTQSFFQWVINSDYRHAVWLCGWLKEQVDHPAPEVLDCIAQHPQFTTGSNDERALSILRFVKGTITYVSDSLNPHDNHASDFWQTAQETLQWGEGDCEDGATLEYVLMRLSGIPENHVFIWTGQVVGGGHACCFYIPEVYPLNFNALDWCYWPVGNDIENRPIYHLIGNAVLGEWLSQGVQTGQLDTNYLQTWFLISESKSYTSISYNIEV